jgi:carbonic anhydrase
MRTTDRNRRHFLRLAGSGLLSAGIVSGFGLAARPLWADQLYITQNQNSRAAMTPQKAQQMLVDGNTRFVQDKLLARDYKQQIEVTGNGQYPFAAIVGCIDSRVPNELIFDQGIGDIFSTRVAGNFVNDDILGSLEFACALSGAKLIVVVGHSECGAIKGACDDVVFGNLTRALANIKPAVAAVPGYESDRTSKNPAFVQAVAEKNVELTLAKIRERSPILKAMADKGDIALAGAMYDVHSGNVAFM